MLELFCIVARDDFRAGLRAISVNGAFVGVVNHHNDVGMIEHREILRLIAIPVEHDHVPVGGVRFLQGGIYGLDRVVQLSTALAMYEHVLFCSSADGFVDVCGRHGQVSVLFCKFEKGHNQTVEVVFIAVKRPGVVAEQVDVDFVKALAVPGR